MLHDGAAVLFFPVPDFFDERLSAEVVLGLAFFAEFIFDLHLGGDAGVVAAGHPQRVVAAHTLVADDDVLQGHVHAVAHVQDAGDVGGAG